jgi:hypothetical protein
MARLGRLGRAGQPPWLGMALGIPAPSRALAGAAGRTSLPRDWPRYWPYLWKLGKQLRIQSWQGGVEIGFADPALTGQCLGLIAALPPQLAQHLRLTFARIGWHGWGSLVIRLRGWQVLGLALKLGWLALSRHRKGSPAKIAHGTAGVRSKALGGELQR